MSSLPADRVHPVLDFTQRLGQRLDYLVDVPVWSMTPEQQRAALGGLAEDKAKIAALELRLLTEADRSGATDSECSGTAADWLAVETRQTRRAARADLKLGTKLESYSVLSAAFDRGQVNVAQVRVIVSSLDKLPRTGDFAVSVDQLREAEAHLVAQAAEFDADTLKRLGDRLLEVIAPEVVEEYEGRKLEADEAKALRKVELSMWEDPEGICHGKFKIPHLHGQMLTKMLASYTNPALPANHPDALEEPDTSGIDPDLPTEVRRGMAFTLLLESISAKELPRTGGAGATIVVTMTLEQLLGDLERAGVCTLDTGGRISASEARRLACTAGILPMVLGGKSQVLDAGRTCRGHTETMRIVMGVRDKGCTAEGCTVPPGMCHAHHDIPWSEGGSTSVESGRLLCPRHHRCIHDPKLEVHPVAEREGCVPQAGVKDTRRLVSD